MAISRIMKSVAIILITVIGLLFLIFKILEYGSRLSLVPNALSVSRIIYAKEESRGFGPGMTHCFVVVYKLPDKIAREVRKNGLKYFRKSPPNKYSNKDWWGGFETWHETPYKYKIEKDDGFTLYIDPRIEQEMCSTVSKRGAFYAEGGSSVIVVSPETKRVYFVSSKECNINVPFPVVPKH